MKRIYIYAPIELQEKYLKNRDVELFDFAVEACDGVLVEKNKDLLIFDIDIKDSNDDVEKLVKDVLKLQEDESDVNIIVINVDPASFKNNNSLIEPEDKRQRNGEIFCDFLCKINNLKSYLEEHVKGQQYVIDKVIGGLINSKTIANNRKSFPAACFTLTGPNGVGKSYLAGIVANFYSDVMDIPSRVFYKSNYPDQDIVKKILFFVSRNPECVLVFNDVEETDSRLEQFLILILNTGEFDGVSFRKAIFFFTTSLGKKIYTSSISGNLSNVSTHAIQECLLTEKISDANFGNLSKQLVLGLSRGKLLMMNYLEPFCLKEIIKNKLENKLIQFSNNTNINLEYNLDELSNCLLYFNKKEYNAQSVSNLVQLFVEREMNDVYNQIDPKTKKLIITSLKNIKITLDLKEAPNDVKALFSNSLLNGVIICGKNYQEIIESNMNKFKNVNFTICSSYEELLKLDKNNIDFILVDVLLNPRKMKYLPTNLEDYNTEGIDIFNYVSTYWNDLPLYVLQMEEYHQAHDNYLSFLTGSCKDIILFNPKNIKGFIKSISLIHQAWELERNIKILISKHQLLTYNSTQIFDPLKKSLEIKLTHLALSYGEHNLQNGKLLSRQSNFKFKDVIGNENAKNILSVYIEYLKNPKKFLENGSKAPKGILLYGESETGKTRLVQAFAGEAGVTLFHHQAGEILIKCMSQDDLKNKIHDIFQQARENAPSILLIDDLDVLIYDTENLMENSIVKFFISEMDNLTSEVEHPVLFVGTTSEDKEEFPSKFIKKLDRSIGITLPNEKEREEFINVCLERHDIKTITKSVIHNIALRTFGESLAYIENLFDFVIKNAYGKTITDKMLLDAVDLYNNGEISKQSDEINLCTAYHEMGHVLIQILLDEHPSFVTIVSRGNFYGYTQPDMHENDGSRTEQDYRNKICCAHGGRVAEELIYGKKGINSGYAGDIKAATFYARLMVCQLGMGSASACLPLISTQIPSKYIVEIEKIIKEEYDRAKELLNNNKDLLIYLAKLLYEKNSLTGEEITEAINNFNNTKQE